MLNELFTLHKRLESTGLAVSRWHPDVKALKPREGFILGIDEKGRVAEIEYADRQKMGELWYVAPDNHNSFPALNLRGPIWRAAPESLGIVQGLWKADKLDTRQRCAFLRRICAGATSAYEHKDKDSLVRRIHDYPKRLLEKFRDASPECRAFVTLMERMAANSGKDLGPFLDRLTEVALAACEQGRLKALDLVQQLLVGKLSEHGEQVKTPDLQVQVMLEVADYADFEVRVAHPDMKKCVSDHLLSVPDDSSEEDGVCSLTAMRAALQTKLPQPKLPILGLTYLMSMNEDIPCHLRYGAVGSAVFPVGTDMARHLCDALVYITAQGRRGKTWQAVPSHKKEGRREKKDLLIAYAEDLPQSSIELANLFSGPAEESEAVEATFEEIASQVHSALKAEPALTDCSLVRVLVLSRFDLGRVQVTLTDAFTVENIRGAVTDWRGGAQNRPSVRFPLPSPPGEGVRIAEPVCPSPASVMRCTQEEWIREGHDKGQVPGCRLSEVYDLFLRGPSAARPTAERLLRMLLQRASPLLAGIGGALGTRDWKPFSRDARLRALTVVSVLAILLDKIGNRKEAYVKGAAFNVGRLLALADTLHREYSLHVRGGEKKASLPNKLIGNALVTTAMENPQAALARLGERLPVYQAWAQTAQGEQLGLAKWALREMGRISAQLAEWELPSSANDGQKAELLLGYLARPEREASE
ncbi:MAG: hypothetical protein Q8Q12_01070 [bacterium]|nr:hypothetical protein [bacterium]